MNEHLQNALANALVAATESVADATEFVLGELPDVAYQALLYYGVYNLTILLVWVGIASYCLLTLGNSKKANPEYWDKRTTDSEDVRYMIPLILRSLTIFIAFCMVLHKLPITLKIWLAPKLWLIEYAGSLVK